MRKKQQKSQAVSRLYTSVLLVLLAFVAVVAATMVFHCGSCQGQNHEPGHYCGFGSSYGS